MKQLFTLLTLAFLSITANAKGINLTDDYRVGKTDSGFISVYTADEPNREYVKIGKEVVKCVVNQKRKGKNFGDIAERLNTRITDYSAYQCGEPAKHTEVAYAMTSDGSMYVAVIKTGRVTHLERMSDDW